MERLLQRITAATATAVLLRTRREERRSGTRIYKELSSLNQTPPSVRDDMQSMVLDRKIRHLVRNSPLKQQLVLLLDLLGLDKQNVDDFTEQGYTPEQVKDTVSKHQSKQSTQGQRNIQ
jgi:hypothetical protein